MRTRDGEAANGGGDEREDGVNDEIEEIEGSESDEGLDPDVETDALSDEEGQGEDEEGDVDPPQRNQRESRYQRAIREAREAKDEVRRLRDDGERSRSQPAAPAYDPEAQRLAAQREAEALELMTPLEQGRYLQQQSERRVGQHLAQMQDQADRREFQRSCQTDRTMARLGPQVEQTIAGLRARGDYGTDRETVFTYLYGKEMREKAKEAVPRQRRDGQRRIASQTTRPGSARGDVPRSRRPAADADENLLRGTTVGDI